MDDNYYDDTPGTETGTYDYDTREDYTPEPDTAQDAQGQDTATDDAAKQYLQKLGIATGEDLAGVREAVNTFQQREAKQAEAEQRVQDDAAFSEARSHLDSLIRDKGLDSSSSQQAENFIAGYIQANSPLTWRGRPRSDSPLMRFWGSEEERKKVVEEAFSEWVKSVLPTSSQPSAPPAPKPSRGQNPGGTPSELHDRAFALLQSTPPKRRGIR
jgi:hypothetical protein